MPAGECPRAEGSEILPCEGWGHRSERRSGGRGGEASGVGVCLTGLVSDEMASRRLCRWGCAAGNWAGDIAFRPLACAFRHMLLSLVSKTAPDLLASRLPCIA